MLTYIMYRRNIIASYIYPDNQAPRYWMACTVEAIALIAAMALTLVFRSLLIRENKKLDEREQAEGVEAQTSNGEKFRYIY